MPAITRGSKSNSILYCGAEQSWSIRRCRLPTALRRVAAPLPCRCCPCALLSLRLSLCCSHHPSVVCYSHCTIARLHSLPSLHSLPNCFAALCRSFQHPSALSRPEGGYSHLFHSTTLLPLQQYVSRLYSNDFNWTCIVNMAFATALITHPHSWKKRFHLPK